MMYMVVRSLPSTLSKMNTNSSGPQMPVVPPGLAAPTCGLAPTKSSPDSLFEHPLEASTVMSTSKNP